MSYKDFEKLIVTNGDNLFSLCQYAISQKSKDKIINRKFLGKLNLEATWMMETLDSHGSLHNSAWFSFREIVAAQRLFSSVCYDVINLKKAVPYYNLLTVEDDFAIDMETILESFYNVIISISEKLLNFFRKQKIKLNITIINSDLFHDQYLNYKLEVTKRNKVNKKQEETLVYLATSFLNLGADIDILEFSKCLEKRDYKNCIPNQISEEKLRLLKVQFHNLQSLYDTYLLKSDLEERNSNLHILRGHISIIFHLLKSAGDLSQYYERHMTDTIFDFASRNVFPISKKKLLSILIEFFLHYSDLYFTAAKNLCKSIIQDYSEEGIIEVEIPNYRGFHVRPSTLISKIVHHYGCNIIMQMGEEKYDAGRPLELFRANEAINAKKRKYISRLLESNTLLDDFNDYNRSDWPNMLQLIILKLMDKEEIILYEKNISMNGNIPGQDEGPEEFFKRIITLFLASGKIDIRSEIFVKFHGDNRVLHDLKILAEAGYGEDKYGNNIILPEDLTYLRR